MTMPRASRPAGETAEHAVRAVVERVDLLLQAEEAALRRHDFSQVPGFTARKAQCLLELSRATRFDLSAQARERLLLPLERLNQRLTTNMHLIQLNLRAVSHVATRLAQTLNNAEADGTYTAAIRKRSAP